MGIGGREAGSEKWEMTGEERKTQTDFKKPYLCPVLKKLNIADFLERQQKDPRVIFDVRSPGEFEKGHIPGATSFPLFDDTERAVVGTLYKQQGREDAVQKGLELVGPKLAPFIDEAKRLCPEGKLYLHCWRGGMRSQNMALLFTTAGFEVEVIDGGYKTYRKHIREFLAKPLNLIILSGETGSGKTDILRALEAQGEQIIDLEGLAHHKGSAFGGLMQPEQPSTEHFENLLQHRLSQLDPEKPIWVEDESLTIGKVYIPNPFWKQMLAAPNIFLKLPREIRVKRLVAEYAAASDDDLADALARIQKRLGGQHVKAAEEALSTKNYRLGAEIALQYYDKAYRYGLAKKNRKTLFELPLESDDPVATAQLLRKHLKALPKN